MRAVHVVVVVGHGPTNKGLCLASHTCTPTRPQQTPTHPSIHPSGDAPYWRGYIWINVNYLTLRALHALSRAEGSPYQGQARGMYAELRDNLLSTILGSYARTGFFWEQYHDETGEGMRCHPFTGWTALVVSIMAEDF